MNNQILKFSISCFIFVSFLSHCGPVFALMLDSSFGQNGLVRTRVGHFMDRAQAVVVQDDGKILVAGSSSNNANLDFALVRYNADGSLDTSFHSNGQVVTLVGSDDDVALGVALQDDGKIVTCGYTFNGKDRDFALVRFTPEGDLDSDFGLNGMVTLAVGSGNDVAAAVAIHSDGKILVSGTVEEAANTMGVLVRFLPNGSLDHSFGKAGEVRVDVGDKSEIAAMAIQKDRAIVLTGFHEEKGQKRVLLVRLLADGLPDPGFGVDGVAETSIDSRDAMGKSLWIQEDGAILVAGAVGGEENQDVALFRFTREGGVDRTFGGGVGMLSHDMNGEDDVGYGVSANSTTIFVAGYTTVNGVRTLTLLQCPLAQDSQQALSVVTAGLNPPDGVAQALALQDDAKIIAVGFNEDGDTSSFVLAQYTGKELAEAKESESGSEVSFIVTTPVTAITRVGCFTGGEILADSGLTFSTRGVVYSIAPYPVWASNEVETTTDPAIEGSTSQGAGIGPYSSILSNLTPGTRYYVRAYGLTSSSVLYGNQLSFETKDACFIATAAYGSLLDPHVQTLRLFRDRYLLTHESGRLFVRLYYHYSPPLAEFIADQPGLRMMVRIFLLPLILCSSIAIHLGVAGMCLVVLAVLGTVVSGFRRRHRQDMI